MKKNFVRVMLFGALTLTVSTVVTSCKDYDDDIKGLQEQVDKITSTSPVSTEDMKSAVEKAKQDLQTQLNDLSALVENPDGEKTLKEKIAALEQALADATGDKAKDLAARLADLQNQLTSLQKILKGEDGVSGLEKKITELEDAKTVLSELIAAEQAYITSGKKNVSAYESTSFGAYVNQAIIDAFKHDGTDQDKWGEIAKYVTGAVQSGITTELGNINAVLTEKYGVSTTLATFVGNVYDKLFSDDAKAQQAQLNELLTAINAYVAKTEGADYANYAALIKQIVDAQKAVAALNMPEGTATLDEGVKALIADEKSAVNQAIKDLTDHLQKEIDAIKGMIQSIVYVPTYADGQVQFNTYYVDFATGGGHDWKSVVNVNEVAVRFRVSPADVIKDLVACYGENGEVSENAKYVISVDCQKVKTRSLNDPFKIKGIKVVDAEPNLIEVTLDASAVKNSYAVALTVTDKVAADKKTLNDVSSNYFAAVKSNLYISKVEWASANAGVATVKKGASIDYKENDGDAKVSDYNVTVNTAIKANGDVDGTPDTKTLSELGISDKYFSVAFSTTANVAANFDLNAETGVLKAKGDAGSQATVQSIVTVTDPATAGEEHPTTKVYDAKEYTEVKIVSEGQAQTATLASTDPILWNAAEKMYNIATTGDAVAVITAIKTALGNASMSDFSGCTFEGVSQDQTIKLGLNGSDQLALVVPANTTCEATDITTKITKGDYTVDVTVKGVTVTLPKETDAAFKLEAITQTDGTLLTNFAKDPSSSKITAVTASRSLKELYSNYDAVYGKLVTDMGGTMKFALVANTQKAAPASRGVTVNENDGTVTVTNQYDGEPINVTLQGKCDENVIFTETIPVIIPAANLNGTFSYKDAETTEFDYDVTDENARKAGFDLTTAFIWKDKNSKEVWPTFATDTYASDAMTIYGFSIEYSLSGNDASSFVKPTISDNKLKLTDAMAKLSMNNANLVVTVKATPTSPWGSMVGQAKTITVKVSTWVDDTTN